VDSRPLPPLDPAYQQAARGRDYDFRWLEERLLPLGFTLVLCTRPAETFAAARAERLKVSGKPDQYDDLDVFLREQDQFRRLLESSILPRVEIDVSAGVGPAADRVADWLEAGGHLYMRS